MQWEYLSSFINSGDRHRIWNLSFFEVLIEVSFAGMISFRSDIYLQCVNMVIVCVFFLNIGLSKQSGSWPILPGILFDYKSIKVCVYLSTFNRGLISWKERRVRLTMDVVICDSLVWFRFITMILESSQFRQFILWLWYHGYHTWKPIKHMRCSVNIIDESSCSFDIVLIHMYFADAWLPFKINFLCCCWFQNTMGILQVIYDLLMMEESTESARTPRNQPTMKELKEVILNRIKDDHQNQRVMKEKVWLLPIIF